MEKIIKLGGEEYKYHINFKLNYDLLKFRNRIQTGFDVTKANKKIITEIVNMKNEIGDKNLSDEESLEIFNKLSPEARTFIEENTGDYSSKFSDEDIKYIVSKFTGIEDENKIYEILDYEVENGGYDKLITKLVNAIAEVFSNAKAN